MKKHKSWTDYFDISVIPDGKSGPWKIERFTITKEAADSFNLGQVMSSAGSGIGPRTVDPGTYVRLRHKDRGVVMSNTRAEMRDHIEPWQKAKGECLIMGLGLGMISLACLRKPEVTKVTVIERDPYVINLVAPTLIYHYGDKINVIPADALEWKPPKDVRYGMVWHDIWDAISEENKPEMSKLHRRFGRRTDWQGSWGKWQIEQMMRRDREYGRLW